MQECHSPEEFKPLLLAFRKTSWKVEGVESAYFPTAPCSRWGAPSRVTAVSWSVLGHPWTISYRKEVASAVAPPPWKYSWQNGCSALFMTSPKGMHYQSQYGYQTGTNPLFFVEASWQWQQRWCVGCSKWRGWKARCHHVSMFLQTRGTCTHSHFLASSLGKALYCTKCLRVSVQWSGNITNQSRKVLKMCENGKEIPIQ